jgi:hypothetical protein
MFGITRVSGEGGGGGGEGNSTWVLVHVLNTPPAAAGFFISTYS